MRNMLKFLKKIIGAEGNIISSLVKSLSYFLRGKKIIAHGKAKVKGLSNITTNGTLYLGTDYVGFMNSADKTFLNIRGKLIVNSSFSIYKGCRLDIGPQAICELGSGYINADTKLIIMHGLKIGDGCAIAWDCEFLDDDFHTLKWENKVEMQDKKIEIGSHVWIGSGVKILKGVKIGSNNVIAANSVVSKSFPEENVLIGGNPAKILKQNISWE